MCMLLLYNQWNIYSSLYKSITSCIDLYRDDNLINIYTRLVKSHSVVVHSGNLNAAVRVGQDGKTSRMGTSEDSMQY